MREPGSIALDDAAEERNERPGGWGGCVESTRIQVTGVILLQLRGWPMSFDDEAVRNKLDRLDGSIPLRDRFAALRAARPLPPATGELADKAFFDDLSASGHGG
jgi:hypothetical protein